MDWQTFYERFFDWTSSTQIQRVRQLTSFGPSDQVTEVAQELMDEKSASRFIRKALEAGVSFTAENIEDLCCSCDKETINAMLEKSREHFTQEQLEDLWGMADDYVINRVAKKNNVRLFDELEDEDPEAEDIEIPQEEYPKKPSFWQSLGIASLLFGGKKRNPPESAAETAPIARPTMATGTVGGIMGMVTPTAVNLVETMEMAETELQHDFQAASSVRVLPGRNLLVGAKSPSPKIRTLFWLRI